METIRVVIVDAHPGLRENIREMLKHEPDIEIVGEAGDGLRALELVEKYHTDVVLMDVIMPGLSSTEATQRIKKSNPHTAVLIMGSYDDDYHLLGLLGAGAAGYVLKSSEGRDIAQALRAVHAGGSVLHASLTGRVLPGLFHRRLSWPGGEVGGLTRREIEVLRLAAGGKSNREIASELSLKVSTVKSHLANIFRKIGVTSRMEAVLEALRKGWVEIKSGEHPL